MIIFAISIESFTYTQNTLIISGYIMLEITSYATGEGSSDWKVFEAFLQQYIRLLTTQLW